MIYIHAIVVLEQVRSAYISTQHNIILIIPEVVEDWLS